MSDPLHINVKPVYIANGNTVRGAITLRHFQEQIENCPEGHLIVRAPTGSGKTLAFLLRLLRREHGVMIAVYPTNELVEDQARNMERILDKLHLSYCVAKRNGIELDVGWKPHPPENRTRVALAVLTGDTLYMLKDHYDCTTEGQALRKLLEQAKTAPFLIILTNPEVMFTLFHLRFAQAKELHRLILGKPYLLIVLDEFHVYWGASLAGLFLLLDKWFREERCEVLFSSATTTEVIDFVPARVNLIQAYLEGDCCVRYPTELTLKAGDLPLVKFEHLEEFAKEVLKLYEEHKCSPASVKVLGILNSLASCEQVYQYILDKVGEENVSRIHSLVPSTARKSDKPIVIGTSALEIGVDLDVASMVFEAGDGASFIQRLGRCCRRRPGQAVAFIPKEAHDKLKRKLGMSVEQKTFSYEDFIEQMDNLLGRKELYGDFIKSEEGVILYLAFLLSLVKNLHRHDERYHEPHNMWNEVEMFLRIEANIPSFIRGDQVRELFGRLQGSSLLDAASRFSGPRNMLTSLPAYHEQYGVWGQVSVLDLSLLDFELRRPEEEPRMPAKWQERGSHYTVYVYGVRRKRAFIRLHCNFSNGIKVLRQGRFKVEGESNQMASEYEKLLDGVLAFETSYLPDWRLAHLMTRNGRICLGTDALVAQFIEKRPRKS